MAARKIVYLHERRGVVAVKQGFSWPAFLFGALWAAAKQMWFPAFWALLVLDIGLWFVSGYAEAQGAGGLALCGLLLNIAYAFVRGRYGNRWLAASLRSKGYTPSPIQPG